MYVPQLCNFLFLCAHIAITRIELQKQQAPTASPEVVPDELQQATTPATFPWWRLATGSYREVSRLQQLVRDKIPPGCCDWYVGIIGCA